MKSREEKSRREKEAEKTKYMSPMICGSGGSKTRLAKAAGAEPLACTFSSQNE